jgi:hypothetical protein
MTTKIPVQSEAELKEFQNKKEIQNVLQYPCGWMKERRARCFALGGGSFVLY